MKSNSGLFRVKIFGFGSSSNFCNKKIIKKKKKKKKGGYKKRKGAGTRNNFFQLNQENILF